MPSNFGFGIGFNYKERQLLVSAQNDTVVEPGMTFHLRISISGISQQPARAIVALGDTVIIAPSGESNKVLTRGIQKSYAEISYSLEESEPVTKEETKDKKSKDPKTDSTRKSNKKGGQSSEDGEASYDDEDDDADEEGSQEIL